MLVVKPAAVSCTWDGYAGQYSWQRSEGPAGIGVDMPFRSIVAEPQELAKLSAAFDAAWIGINSATPIPPADQSAARERLGYIIIGLWKQGEERLGVKGVELFLDSTPKPGAAADKKSS